MIDGRKFNCVASIARAHGLNLVTVRRRIDETGKVAEKLTNDEWKLILSKKKVKKKLSPTKTEPIAKLISFVVNISSTPTLFTRKSKPGLIALTKSSEDRLSKHAKGTTNGRKQRNPPERRTHREVHI